MTYFSSQTLAQNECGRLRYKDFERVTNFDQLEVYKIGDISLSEVDLQDISRVLQLIPDAMSAYQPDMIIIAGDNGGLTDAEQEILNTSGGYAYCNTIVVSHTSLQGLSNRPVATYKRVGDVIIHEWMHIVQGGKAKEASQLSRVVGYVAPLHSKFVSDYGRAVGWDGMDFLDTYQVLTPNLDDPEFLIQSEYGISGVVEDQAETARLYFSGQPQLLSADRIEWIENFTATKAEDYSALVVPIVEGEYEHLYAEGEKIPLDGAKTIVAKEKVQEYMDKYTYVTMNMYKYEDNSARVYFFELDEEMKKRGFINTIPLGEVCNEELFECRIKYQAGEYKSLFSSVYIAHVSNYTVVLEGSYRTQFIVFDIPDIFNEDVTLEEN